MSAERVAITEALREEDGPMTPLQIASVTGGTRVSVRRLVTKMASAGELTKVERGKYALPTWGSVTSVTG